MRKLIKPFIVLLAVAVTAVLSTNHDSRVDAEGEGAQTNQRRPLKGPDLERWYFAQWHYPHGSMLSSTMMSRIWSEIERLPSETQLESSPPNSWIPIGPFGMSTKNGGGKYTGRILDVEIDNGVGPRVAAASGGLWGVVLPNPVHYTDKITSQAIATFDSDPANEQIIFAGTGEPGTRSGTGLWKTTNRGASWNPVPLTPTPTGFYRIRFRPGSSTVIHAATSEGYYRSEDGGTTWNRTLSTGPATDLAIDPTNPDIIYTSVIDDALYKTTNGGVSWNRLTTGGIPTASIGRVALSLSSANPGVVYASIETNGTGNMLGVYRTTDGGVTWSTISPMTDFLSGQGWYDNVIGVSPTDPNLVLVGGVEMLRSTNGGSDWTQINDEQNLHVDHHAIEWNPNGTEVWVGNDGGLSYSSDAGLTWSTAQNVFPITQYVNIDVDISTNREFAGGSQDNGISITTDNGASWVEAIGGDGGGVVMDNAQTPNRFWITLGFFEGDWAFQRLRTTNNGTSFDAVNNGVDPSDQWFHKVRKDGSNPVVLFNNSGPNVYRSSDFGDTWTKMNPAPFPANVFNLHVSRPSGIVYASLESANDGERLRVYDGGVWQERSAGLPGGVRVRGVAPHPTDDSKAYALMNGFSAGNKVLRTTDRGATWTNISGDCPDVPLGDLVPHPTNDNLLYLGTEMGCYRTTNGGAQWHRWNNGMPEANIITEMKWIDSLAINGKFYVVAGSYGRGIWLREVSGDDPTTFARNDGTLPDEYALLQNYPNPFNPGTTIRFQLPENQYVLLDVFDAAGRKVANLVAGQLPAGPHEYSFNADRYASGIYFYRLSAGEFIGTRKMVLMK